MKGSWINDITNIRVITRSGVREALYCSTIPSQSIRIISVTGSPSLSSAPSSITPSIITSASVLSTPSLASSVPSLSPSIVPSASLLSSQNPSTFLSISPSSSRTLSIRSIAPSIVLSSALPSCFPSSAPGESHSASFEVLIDNCPSIPFPNGGDFELGPFGDPEECAGICQAAGNSCVGFSFAYGGGPLVLCTLYAPFSVFELFLYCG